ncbi:VC1465 family Xer recombination activation factor [Rhodanobacter sp. Root627]|uniref:VC1465 family Xer recombination activation factor n=1 Tax=Rhodanobacter sp. Root627 TaxID=1736572 RepID=UPI0031B5E76F
MPDEAAPSPESRPVGRPLGRPRRGARRPRRRLWLISPDGFRELRHSCLLSQKQAAAYLGVCLRTVRHWDSGRNRVPWSAVRLLRLLRAGELGGLLDGWEGWRVVRDRLVSPEGRVYRERDMRHWWLTIEQAHLFREGYDAATRPGAAQPREGSGTTVTFPCEVIGQGEGRTEVRPGFWKFSQNGQ